MAALVTLTAGCRSSTAGRDQPRPGATTAPDQGTGGGPPPPSEPPLAAPTGGRRLVVAPGGSDKAAGTEAAPWATVGHSLAQLGPGDTLLLRGGRYRERITEVPVRAGRADARITVAAMGGAGGPPVIEGLLWLRGTSHWTITGLRVTWSGGRADQPLVKLTDGVDWRLEGNEVSGARSVAAVLVSGTRRGEPADWAVRRNCVHGTVETNAKNQDRLIVAETGTDAGSGVVEGNVVFGAPNGAGIELGGPGERGAANVSVRFNTVYDTAQNVVVAGDSHSNEIRANIVGRTSEEYGNIRGYRLDGTANVAIGNVGFQSSRLILNDPGHRGIEEGTANRFGLDPDFDAVDRCDAFRPRAAEAAGAGHLAAPP